MSSQNSYIGVVDYFDEKEECLYMKRVGLIKSNIEWFPDASFSEEMIRSVDLPSPAEMVKYLNNDRDLIQNESVH
ncbi:hypothetical protein P9VFCI_193 [Rhizobium phage P9VFCI]|uniref:Uncharacterized protein n=3 Tax=Innesvirus TaxID=3044739 RepID=A0A076YKK5_9CAUD|nr:hypothetical protein P10VF_099 [Rhizobium phage vB_RleM_P10VF]YP_010662086.1 hypothetical protein PP937_gp193 [Rhizobium phage P9VFCI]YP_010662283.1 hypothetical protein PP938_gp133 [Rhizobium phage AF3]AIK68312.1 hypothetical protein P10VF_099 [Rhizobium phage vB_RleM_P10VF]QNH71573.1 hypothetical protein AF3_133 [Rhizobium phage AF3]QNH71991.1 hypothetical protein P9VFCI_193 [Rhizobium phage P9VFCI]